jgi:asparagine synthase (glutamine-hydrolysing)
MSGGCPSARHRDGHPPAARYRSKETGGEGKDPLELASAPVAVSLQSLALLLSTPSIVGEFQPACLWRGVRRLPSSPTPPRRTESELDLVGAFRRSIARCLGDADTVAVAVSGGLDSLATLVHAEALCRKQGRRLVAVTVDLADDVGRTTSGEVARFLAELQLDCDLEMVPPSADTSFPSWRSDGPYLGAMPRLATALSDRAASCGAQVLLSGDGSDELLGATRYLLWELLVKRRWKTAAAYARDSIGFDRSALVAEGAAVAVRVLPRRVRAPLYWALNWPELCSPRAPDLLGGRYRQHVEQWTAHWIAASVELHRQAGGTWSACEAWDALWPYERLHPAGALPELSPFLEDEFFQLAHRLLLSERYDGGFNAPYHRQKALVVRLFPPALRCALPTAKQTFSSAFAEQQKRWDGQAPLSLQYGLVTESGLRRCTDPAVLLRVETIERWLRQALEGGAVAVADEAFLRVLNACADSA